MHVLDGVENSTVNEFLINESTVNDFTLNKLTSKRYRVNGYKDNESMLVKKYSLDMNSLSSYCTIVIFQLAGNINISLIYLTLDVIYGLQHLDVRIFKLLANM